MPALKRHGNLNRTANSGRAGERILLPNHRIIFTIQMHSLRDPLHLLNGQSPKLHAPKREKIREYLYLPKRGDQAKNPHALKCTSKPLLHPIRRRLRATNPPKKIGCGQSMPPQIPGQSPPLPLPMALRTVPQDVKLAFLIRPVLNLDLINLEGHVLDPFL